jgi:high frequency lysogenization protein
LTVDVRGQTLALAAIFQVAGQVETLAKTGRIPNADIENAVKSLFCQNPSNLEDVYGDVKNIEAGLKLLRDTLQRKPSKSNDTVRYVMGILHLQKRLHKNPSMLNIIGSRLEKTQKQLEHFSHTHDNIMASLASIYSDTISTFSFRIQVVGEYQYLQQTRLANQIRALLFSGIRSAVLWRQLGGSRLRILFKRKQIINIIEDQLKSINQNTYH